MLGWIRHIACSLIHAWIAFFLACNYFSFQVELFSEEYEVNQPMRLGTEDEISSPTLTWESFDKDHAQKPFIFNALARIESTVRLHPVALLPFFDEPSRLLIRDKSPPSSV